MLPEDNNNHIGLGEVVLGEVLGPTGRKLHGSGLGTELIHHHDHASAWWTTTTMMRNNNVMSNDDT